MRRTVAVIAVILLTVTAGVAFAGGKKCAEQTAAAEIGVAKIAEKYRSKGWLGIETDHTDQGLIRVTRVLSNSPAATAGFRPGDILVALNDVELTADNKTAVKKAKMKLGPGSEVEYTVKREGGKVKLAATLASPPDEVVAQWVDEYVKEHSKQEQVAVK